MGDNFLDATKRETVRLIVVVGRIAATAVEVQVVTVSRIVLCTAPIVPVGTLIVERPATIVAVAARRQE